MASVRVAAAQDAVMCAEIVTGLADMIDPLPGWPPGNPAALLAVALAPTR